MPIGFLFDALKGLTSSKSQNVEIPEGDLYNEYGAPIRRGILGGSINGVRPFKRLYDSEGNLVPLEPKEAEKFDIKDSLITESEMPKPSVDAVAERKPMIPFREEHMPKQKFKTDELMMHAKNAGIPEDELPYFMGQLAHESGGFKWTHELGGKNYFKRYDGRKDLGNTQPGDGYRFRGRGFIQLTGRHNYKRFGEKLGLDLENNPELAAQPDVAMKVAAEYWRDRNIGKYAKAGNIRKITKLINGGYNGLRDRIKWTQRFLGN